MAKWVCFGLLFFNLIQLIQLCDKKNLTFIDSWDKIILNLSWKNVIKLAKGSLNNIFQDSFNIILSQQLTHDRSYISSNTYINLANTVTLKITSAQANRGWTLLLLMMTQESFVNIVDQDQTAKNMQSDLWPILTTFSFYIIT